MRKATFLLFLAPLSELGAAEWPDGAVYAADSSDDRVLRLIDRDGSGLVEAAGGEVAVYYDDASPGPDLSTPNHLLLGQDGRIYLLDGGTVDAVLALEDRSGDGDANDPGEVSVFYDASAGGPRLYTPNGVVQDAAGVIYIGDDGSSGKRILRLADANADGDALDAGEAAVVYDSSALATPLCEDIEALAIAGGALYASDATLQAVFRFADGNADGDFLDPGESSVFFQPPPESPLPDIEALAGAPGGGLLVAEKTTGKILRLRDEDGDGVAAGVGEVFTFLDETAAIEIAGINDFLPVSLTEVLVIDNSKDAIFIAADRNGDGDALDATEVVRWLVDDGTSFATPHGLAFGPRGGDPQPGATFIRSDATGDGKVDISDPVATLGYLFLGATLRVCLDVPDSDDSGDLTISDAIYSLNYLFGGGPSPPVPFPEAGQDPTPDGTDC